ncbi:MAG: transporter [Gracilimonas sp.]|uniref:transporter n=1 Tax=Gracilimonas TaxID=649462 RepID=UPI001B05C2CF|nr:transporter [Gracilimonas sp.]MBO6585204.1 transporter [Gracilimonas sp.]MBO6615524.1 transporter [Gracilimonas sp.]
MDKFISSFFNLKSAFVILTTLLTSNYIFAQENYTPDRPGIGNGSYVVEAGVFGLETGVQLSTGNAVNQFDIGQMLLRFGVMENLELRALLNSYSTQYFDRTDAVNSGFQDLGLAAKYKLYEAEDGQTRISTIGKISVPVGASAFTNDEIVPTLFLVGDQSLTNNLSISSNLGYTFGVGDLSDNWLFTLTPGFSFPNQQNLSAYAGYAGIYDGNNTNLHYAEAGLALVVNDGAQLDLNAGYEFERESFFIGIGFAQGFATARN